MCVLSAFCNIRINVGKFRLSGRTVDGLRNGIFPRDFVEPVGRPEDGHEHFVATCEFQAQQHGDLCFNEGDVCNAFLA